MSDPDGRMEVKCTGIASSAWYILMSLVGLVLVQSFRELVTSVYYFSLVNMGPSPEIAAVLVVSSPLIIIPASKLFGWRAALILTGAFTALARLPLGLGLLRPFQLVFSALAFGSASAFLILALSIQRREKGMDPDVFSSQGATGALSLSLLLQMVLLYAGNGLDISIVPEAAGIILSPLFSSLIAGTIGFLLFLIVNAPLLDPRRGPGGGVGHEISGGAVDSRIPFVGLGSFLAISALVLPYSQVGMVWLGREDPMVHSMSLLAVSLFILSLFSSYRLLIGLRTSFAPPKGSIVANLSLIGAALNMFVFRFALPISPLVFIWMSLVNLWLIIDAILDTDPFAGVPVEIERGDGTGKRIGIQGKRGVGRSPGIFARRMVLTNSIMLIFPVLVVLSLNSAFIPGGGIFEGRIPLFMVLPAVLLAVSGFMCSKKGIYEPCIRERCREPIKKGSPAIAAGSGTGHPVRRIDKGKRLGVEWMVTGSVTVILIIAGSAAIYMKEVSFEPPGSGVTTGTITVMTYNIHQGFNNDGRADPVRVLETIKEYAPDIVFLQETEALLPSGGNYDLTRYMAYDLGMHYVRGPPPWEGTYGLSILSRFPIDDGRVVMLSYDVEKKYFLRCSTDIGGVEVTLVCVHLGHDEIDRPVQTDELAAALNEIQGPLIVGGDFNSEPRDPLMEKFNSTLFGPNGTLSRGGNRSATLDLVSGWHCSRERNLPLTAHTWPASDLDDERAHIDYVLMSTPIDPIRSRINDRKDASDHRPVAVELDVRALFTQR